MTDEERQQQMDFILENQARFAARLEHEEEERQRLEQLHGRMEQFMLDTQVRTSFRLDRIEGIAKLFVRAGLRGRRQMREQDARIAALVGSQLHLEEMTRRNSENIDRLAEIVGQLANRQNGNGQPGSAQ